MELYFRLALRSNLRLFLEKIEKTIAIFLLLVVLCLWITWARHVQADYPPCGHSA